MSFDPYDSSAPRSDDPIRGEPVPDVRRPASDVASWVRWPAILLIIVSVLNLALSGGSSVLWGLFAYPSAEMMAQVERGYREQMKKQDPKVVADLEKAGYTPEFYMKLYARTFGTGAVLGLFSTLIGIVGGIRMLQQRSYGFCIFASVVVAIPCLSPVSCCLIGEAVGIWSLIVLLNTEVRNSFK